jgi:hypothetical protein
MKAPKIIFSALLFAFCLFLIRCSSDHSGLVNTPTNGNTTTTFSVLVTHNWNVDYYFTDTDHSNDFTGYRIWFMPDGNVNCENTSGVATGAWTQTTDSLNNDVITINFGSTDASILELNKSWTVTGRTDHSLQFQAPDTATNTTAQMHFMAQ